MGISKGLRCFFHFNFVGSTVHFYMSDVVFNISNGNFIYAVSYTHLDVYKRQPLEFAVLDAVMEKRPGFPIVLHGSSSVPQEEVDTINKYGGKLEAAIGIPEEQLLKACLLYTSRCV